MLITSSEIKQNDIVAFKLVSGDEIVAKVVQINPSSYEITTPIALLLAPTGSVAFAPFMLASPEKTKMILSFDRIVVECKARDEIKNAYIQNTSGIVPAGGAVPGSGNLVG